MGFASCKPADALVDEFLSLNCFHVVFCLKLSAAFTAVFAVLFFSQ